MKTMEELFQEVLGSDGLKGAFAQAVSEGRMEEFLKEHGCEASPEEVKAFLQEKQTKEGELSEAELDAVSGGCGTKGPYVSAVSGGCGTIEPYVSAVSGGCGTVEPYVTSAPDPSKVTINIC